MPDLFRNIMGPVYFLPQPGPSVQAHEYYQPLCTRYSILKQHRTIKTILLHLRLELGSLFIPRVVKDSILQVPLKDRPCQLPPHGPGPAPTHASLTSTFGIPSPSIPPLFGPNSRNPQLRGLIVGRLRVQRRVIEWVQNARV